MKEFSKEIIEIGGKEYTLFLNRKGIVAFEKFCRDESQELAGLQKKYAGLTNNAPIKIDDKTDPFEGLEAFDDMSEDEKLAQKMYQRLYWIMLYTEHQLPLSEVEKLYNEACEEYGNEQVIALANQMFEDANVNIINQKELKNLAALRPTK